MGRTVIPYSQILKFEEESLKNYRRSLPAAKQEIIDEIFRIAKSNLASGVMASNTEPFHIILLSHNIELHREIDELKKVVARLQKQINGTL
ncbi:hypothetical protein LEP1GSC185_3967 [Leptospira licerasiae serovar Varillal str. VAR 010]|uniref:DUF8156 domain-containing protein n=1 Tax=Leptospira licerasiae str. MMD4847 TaxID=1049971 RepID=A0ABN0H9N5_9LEPT|nr:hypothetical protein LEP1GSC185_3967 [Leptospira licerasiae serovar Varillal str. VAR 010]EJZ42300.1 hypothetical protein LEP1GSC178_0036 [Leptospira licerasiae str. MMD4847]